MASESTTLLFTALGALGFGTILGTILTNWNQSRMDAKKEKRELKRQLVLNFLECSDEATLMLNQLKILESIAAYLNVGLSNKQLNPKFSELLFKKEDELNLAVITFNSAKAKFRSKVDFHLFYLGDNKTIIEELNLFEQIINDKEINKINSLQLNSEKLIDLNLYQFQEKLVLVMNRMYFKMREMISKY
jgi:hypothetical protein